MNQKIVITGTKGKTTVAFIVDQILQILGKNTIRVDTTGHFVNGKRKSTLEDSKRIWGLMPTVCPGRFLWELNNFSKADIDNAVAILESALGCGNMAGTGLKSHDVGVWTNVLEDHIGSTARLQTRSDIADAKDFVFKGISDGGYAVFNACDELVCSKIDYINKSCTKVPFVYDEKCFFNLDEHLNRGGTAFVLEDTKILQKTKAENKLIYDAINLPWTFRGYFKPSLINLMCAIATVYASYGGTIPPDFAKTLDQIRLDPYGGRLTVLNAKNGTMIIADYAHEKQSLAAVGALAKKLAGERKGKTIGVVRLAYDRTDQLVDETGQEIGKSYDSLVVYDKIDGYWRQPVILHSGTHFVQEVGRTSSLLEAAIKKTNRDVARILREDQAIEYAAKIAEPQDVVVIIVNDNVERSIDWIREKFKAEFA